jgi:hypothetical protein
MLIPQYSLRWLLGATTVCAMACSVFAMALRGSLLAAAVSMAIVALVAMELVHVVLFVLVWLFSQAFSPSGSKAAKGVERAVLIVLALAASWAAGGGGLARAQTVVGDGLRMDIGFDTVAATAGYRPVRISVLPIAPVTADRTLSIEILLGRAAVEGYDLRVVGEMEIPAGSGRQTITIPVPPVIRSTHYQVNVIEDRAVLSALHVPWTPYSNWWTEALPTILFMGNSPPDSSGLAAALPVENAVMSGAFFGKPPPPRSGSQLRTVECWALPDFPDQWINYSGFDIVCLSRDQLADLGTSRPAALRALAAWTAAGGNLWVWDLGDQWQHVPEVEKILGLPPGRGAATAGAPPGWKVSNKHFPLGFPGPPRFLLRPMQAGLVVALASAQPFPGTAADWGRVLGSTGDDRWCWYQRHGLSLKRTNPDFWNFLIPGVGLAPVTQFCVLISVFVIGIGPVNYWLLRRRRQLHLLLLTIPASAAAVTLLLFAYALVADGLDVRVRARSVTRLDQRSGRAVCWTRLSYFAGLTPRGGLRFPSDTVVLPLEQLPGGIGREMPLSRDLLWEEDQHLASGWLASRTPTQLLTIRSRMSSVGLDLVEAAGQGKAPAVRNRLQTPITRLLVRTSDGKYYRARAVGVGATAALEPISAAAEAGVLELLQRDRLFAPPGASQASAPGGFGMSRSYYIYMFSNHESLPEPAVATSRLEQMRLFELEPGGYVAVVERSPEVVFGVPAPREEPSSHVILGEF